MYSEYNWISCCLIKNSISEFKLLLIGTLSSIKKSLQKRSHFKSIFCDATQLKRELL